MSQTDQDEIVMVLLAQQGDVAAFEELLRCLHGPLRRYVNRLVGESDADDVMQDSAIRLYRNIRYLREPVVFRAWAFRIATLSSTNPKAPNFSEAFGVDSIGA